MEQNPPILAKKVWNLIRVVCSMLRKGISKRKILLDLNMMIKRGKIASKTLHNLMFHHHHHKTATNHLSFSSPPPSESEFSCTQSPINEPVDDIDMRAASVAVMKAMEMIHSENASPVLPGFGRSPVVRQLRVTDSPFAVNSVDEDNYHVDEDAERFISQFYHDLRRQNT